MKFTYDKIANAGYLYLRKDKVFRTVEISRRIIVDLNEKGKVVGIEILLPIFYHATDEEISKLPSF